MPIARYRQLLDKLAAEIRNRYLAARYTPAQPAAN